MEDELPAVEQKPKRKRRRKTYPQMPIKERDAWNELDMFIRKNVMGYDDVKGLTTNMVLRLKGLRWGQSTANLDVYKRSDYTFETILTAYKAYIYEIRRAMSNKTFENDEQKFAYALKIVENHVPEIYQRMKNMREAKKNAEQHVKETVEDNSSKRNNQNGLDGFRQVNDNVRRQQMFEEFW